jgi:hypothetical protein
MEEINKFHSQGVECKKEYLAALSLPVREVAEAVGNSGADNGGYVARRKSMTLNNAESEVGENVNRNRYAEIPSSKLPNAQVNQDKLKIILQQLKKVDRNALHTSR